MNLKDYRALTGLTLEQLAEKLGAPYGTLMGWVYGTRRPSVEDSRRIEKRTGGAVRLDDFYPVNENKNGPD